MIKSTSNGGKIVQDDIISEIDNEKIDRIIEDSKLNLAIVKETIDREKNDEVFQSKIDTLSNKINEIKQDLNDNLSKNKFDEVLNSNKKIQENMNKFIFDFSNQIEFLHKDLNEIKLENEAKVKEVQIVKEEVKEEVKEDPINQDIELVEEKSKLLKNIEDFKNQIDEEEELLMKDMEMEGEVLEHFKTNKVEGIDKLIKPINDSIFEHKETINFIKNNIDKTLVEIDEINKKIINDEIKEIIDSNLSEISSIGEMNKLISKIYEEYNNKKSVIEKNINQNFDFIKFFSNLDLTLENSESLEYIIQDIKEIKSNFDIENLLITKLIQENELSKDIIESFSKETFTEKHDLEKNNLILNDIKTKVNDSIKKLNKYIVNAEKNSDKIIKIGEELERLFDKSKNDNQNIKAIEKKVIEKIKAKNSVSIDSNYIENLKNEVKNDILNSLSQVETKKEEIFTPKEIAVKEVKNNSNVLPVFIMNGKKEIIENLDFNINKLKWCSYTDLDLIKYSKSFQLEFNKIENFSNKLNIMNIDFEDWLTPTINSKSVIGKILTNKYYYNNLEIKGNQLGPVVLFYNDEEPVFFQNEISQPVIFDNVEILSKEEIKSIIKQEYRIENFDIELCYYCSPSLSFLIPSYHIKFLNNEMSNLYFPASKKFLPKLSFSEINVKSYTIESIESKTLETLDEDNIGNDFIGNKEYQVFNIELKDLISGGDNLNVFSDFETKMNGNGNFDILIPTKISKENIDKLNKINVSIICQNNFGFENVKRFELNLTKYKNLFKVDLEFNHGGNRHNFGLNNFDSTSGFEISSKFRNKMKSHGILEEYVRNEPNTITGNADMIVNVSGGDKLNSMLLNEDEEFTDVEHIINLTSFTPKKEELVNIFDKKVHLLCGFDKNVNKSIILEEFFKKSYQDKIPIINSWLISSISNGMLSSSPYITGPLIRDSKNKNVMNSSIKNFSRGFLFDSVWGTNPGPGLDLTDKVDGVWKIVIS